MKTPIYQKVESLRKTKGITQVHLANSCGKTPQWYHSIKSGKTELKVDDLYYLSKALDVPIGIFFEEEVSEMLSS